MNPMIIKRDVLLENDSYMPQSCILKFELTNKFPNTALNNTLLK